MSDILIYGLGGLILYQAYVTIRVMKHKSATREQRRRQYLIIWLVPFVGAAITLASLTTDAKANVRLGKGDVDGSS